MRAFVKKALIGLVERYASHLAAGEVAFESRRSTAGEEERIKTSRVEMDAAITAVADEIDALDAWRDAVCAGIWTKAPETDAGGYGCDGEHDGNHDERCPVAIARVTFFAATDRRRALVPGKP